MPLLLIVTANFPPVNAPDMQRVRMSLPHFTEAGWEVVILTVDDKDPLAPLEPDLLETIPVPVRIVRAPVWSRRWTRYLGINNLGFRALLQIYATGCRLLSEHSFDLVYFSTTQFILMPLGRLWRLQYGVPYVIDLQDPWINDYYQQPGAPQPPGGWKYFISQGTARLLEGWTIRRCAHVISVSARYVETLARRYSWFDAQTGSVLTFGAPDADLAAAREQSGRLPRLLPSTPALKIAYAGRLGPDMEPALDHLFAAIAGCKEQGLLIELHFYGTSYAPDGAGAPTTTALAARHGITAQVTERTSRIGYLQSLRLLLETDLALLLGSSDRAYSPSKVYSTLLAGTPTIAVAPAGSVLEHLLGELGGVALVTHPSTPGRDAGAVRQLVSVLQGFAGRRGPLGTPLDRGKLLEKYSARAIAARQLELFNRIIRANRPALPPLRMEEYWPELPPETDPPA